jgi:hypothetical protein
MAILSDLGIQHSNVHVNLSSEALIQISLETDKGSALSDTGALMVYSGEKTGRSPKDKRIVLEESSKEHINWGDVNQPIDPASFNQAKNNAIAFFNSCADLFIVDGYAVWDKKNRIKVISDLHNLSNDIKITFETCSERIIDISKKIKENNMFLLGKGSDECVAKEGSLKIKEISYIHSEGYSSSSLKHGPFALLDEKFPVIILNLDQKHRAKTINCYQEVLSRNSPIIFITNDYTVLNEINESACYVILIPENKSYSSLLGILPLQLLAYNLSVNRGINPDKPKNLAKVVTVE